MLIPVSKQGLGGKYETNAAYVYLSIKFEWDFGCIRLLIQSDIEPELWKRLQSMADAGWSTQKARSDNDQHDTELAQNIPGTVKVSVELHTMLGRWMM